jgi:hypothetical protein
MWSTPRPFLLGALVAGWAALAFDPVAGSAAEPARTASSAAFAGRTVLAAGEPTPLSMSSAARHYYATKCVTCHGATGHGDGPAAGALNPKPQDFARRGWQRSVTNAYLAKVIVEGGAAVGKSPTMPPHPDLRTQPKLVRGLVALIRSFGGG